MTSNPDDFTLVSLIGSNILVNGVGVLVSAIPYGELPQVLVLHDFTDWDIIKACTSYCFLLQLPFYGAELRPQSQLVCR